MDAITRVEDALMDLVRTSLGAHIRGVDSLPGDWDGEDFKRLLHMAPGAFVSFGGGKPREGAELLIAARFTVLVCTSHANGEAARRRGDGLQIGAYQMVAMLAPLLQGANVSGEGTARVVDLVNLFTGTIEQQGLSVYAIVLEIPMLLEPAREDNPLAEFQTFDVAWDVPPHSPLLHPTWAAGLTTDNPPDARDTMTDLQR